LRREIYKEEVSFMVKNINSHICKENVDHNCKCKICGVVCHSIVNDSKGNGTGMVTEWCTNCGKYERYYDDTGTVIESTFRDDIPYNGPVCGGRELNELAIRTDTKCDDMDIVRKARGTEIQRNQQRVFLCWDFENKDVRDIVVSDLLSHDAGADCVVSYIEIQGNNIDENELEQELRESQMLILVISQNLLLKIKDLPEYSIAKRINLPIIPVALDNELLPKLTQQIGAVHGLSIADEEYRIKLKTQLDNMLVSDALINEINEKAFTGRVFLSYRKKDLALARKFMAAFHDIPGFESIAIWYDNFLNAGRVFSEEIEKSIDDSDVFTLLVTPNITESGNYVLMQEYPYAIGCDKSIVAVEVETPDKQEFFEKYKHAMIYTLIDGIHDTFSKIMPNNIVTEINPTRCFLLGVAFYKGILVEKDIERAISLLTRAATKGDFQSARFLGKTYYDLLKYEDSVNWYKKAAEICGSSPNGEGAAAEIYNAIANNFIERGDYKSALEWSLKALPIQEKLFGESNLSVAKTLTDICNSYQNMGDLSNAQQMLDRAADVYSVVADTEKADYIIGCSNIAMAYHNNMSFAKAMKMHLKAVASVEKTYGTENPLTSCVYTRAALTYLRIGVNDTALDLLNKALDISRKTLPPEHPETAQIYILLGDLYDKFGNFPLMLDMKNKALSIQEKVFGKDSWITALTYRDIGTLYAKTESYSSAKDLLLPAFNTLRKALGMNHPFTLETYQIMRTVFDQLGIADADDFYS